MNIFKQMLNMGIAKRKKKRKIRIPSESEYYDAFKKWNPERPGLSEKARIGMRRIKNNPPDYQLIKKIYDEINANNGYR